MAARAESSGFADYDRQTAAYDLAEAIVGGSRSELWDRPVQLDPNMTGNADAEVSAQQLAGVLDLFARFALEAARTQDAGKMDAVAGFMAQLPPVVVGHPEGVA